MQHEGLKMKAKRTRDPCGYDQLVSQLELVEEVKEYVNQVSFKLVDRCSSIKDNCISCTAGI